jgi:hypothetical protein
VSLNLPFWACDQHDFLLYNPLLLPQTSSLASDTSKTPIHYVESETGIFFHYFALKRKTGIINTHP